MSEASQDRVTADGHLQTQAPSENAATELSTMVDDLLDSISTKFSAVSADLFAKMDDMSRRLDNLEASIQAQAGGENVGTS